MPFAVAFSPDDKWIASGAGDRSVKIWDAQKGVRPYTLTDATEAVTTLQFQRRRAGRHGGRERQDPAHVVARGHGPADALGDRAHVTDSRAALFARRKASRRAPPIGRSRSGMLRREPNGWPSKTKRLAAGPRVEPGWPHAGGGAA